MKKRGTTQTHQVVQLTIAEVASALIAGEALNGYTPDQLLRGLGREVFPQRKGQTVYAPSVERVAKEVTRLRDDAATTACHDAGSRVPEGRVVRGQGGRFKSVEKVNQAKKMMLAANATLSRLFPDGRAKS